MNTRKWIAVSLAAGIVVYYCEWLELVYSGACNQGLAFTLARMYAVPLIVSGVLGYFCFSNPLACWLSFMLPSWIVRLVQLAISVAAGSNLSPLLIAVDAGHLLLTGVVAAGGAKVGRSQIKKESKGPGSNKS
jgi:hypothetical protein